MSGRKVCLNCPTSYYTGKEQSPLHFGLSAEGYEINSIMEGFDKDLWIVEIRNNKKVWTKKEHINKMTYEIPLINETNNVPKAAEPVITESSPPSQPSQVIDADATDNAKAAVSTASTASTAPSSTPATAPAIAPAIAVDTSKNKEKVSKTIKPTDYTLFITYRIHQMKGVSSDNKKNYDTAREEWKEYKKKPDELRLIMVEANNFHK